MNITKNNLTIRNALKSDAKQLLEWWNNGEIMAHAGFPNGFGITMEKIEKDLATNSDETFRIHIVEYNNKPIGEMNYRNEGNKVASIGIKICDFLSIPKGTGTALLTMFIDALFNQYEYDKIILNTNTQNKRAQHVYENKLGFKKVGVRENSWRNQLGELQSCVDYELTHDQWLKRDDL